MAGLLIENPQLAERLRRLAAQENLSIEELLIDLVEQRSGQPGGGPVSAPQEASAAVARLHRLACERARRYWQESGDAENARLSDEQLEAQGLHFDEQDRPRLKDGPSPGSALARLALSARAAQLPLGEEAVSMRSDDILHDEFADYLLKREHRQDRDATS